MKWLYNKQYMQNDDKGISGKRITLLSLFHISLMLSSHKGKHISLGFGIGSCELAIQFSYWITQKNIIKWNSRNVGRS